MSRIVTQSDYTSALVSQRNDLADNIDTMGVEAEQTEKLNTLVPKVLEISTGVSEETMSLLKNKMSDEGILIPDDATDDEIIGILLAYPWSKTAKWFISSYFNNGYPNYSTSIGTITDVWDDSLPHNPSLWRIDELNNGYPYTYYMKQWLEGE